MMRLVPAVLAALVAFGSAGAAAAAPQIAEHRLNAEEIRDLARREVLWCDDHHASKDDCDALTLKRLLPDGRLAETTSLMISESPRLVAYIGDVDTFEGDRVCSRIKSDETPIGFRIEGHAVPAESSAGLRALLATSLAEFDGKVVCQTFYRGSDPTHLREEVTVDGERRLDLETTYVIREGGSFSLRPQVERDEKAATEI